MITTKTIFNRENDSEMKVTYDIESVDAAINRIGDRNCSDFVKGYGRFFDTESQMRNFSQQFSRDGFIIRRMTVPQSDYLRALEVVTPKNATLDYASWLIERKLAEIEAEKLEAEKLS